MKQITQLGANQEEAISLALQNLGVSRELVEVEVLQEGKKGFLGFGARPAEVRVTVKEVEKEVVEVQTIEEVQTQVDEPQVEATVTPEENLVHTETEVEVKDSLEILEDEEPEEVHQDPVEVATVYLEKIAKEMDIKDLTVHASLVGKHILLKLESEKAALLIGKRGATLNALQQLTQLVVNKSAKSFLLVKLDVENYRERRQTALEILAERMADKAIRTGRKVELEPMPSYERKVIHHTLSNRIDIETYSEGTEPNRYLVIEPIK